MIAAAAEAWRRWRAPLSAGVLDQVVVSGANFVLNVLLARWMSPSNYGEFAIAFAVLLLVAGPHGALLTDPLNVVGVRRFYGRYPQYLRALLTLHAALTIPLGALIAAVALWSGATPHLPAAWLVTLGIVTPVVLLLWLLRGACYLELRPGGALTGSALYGIVLLGLVLLGHLGSWLTPPMAVVLMGVASALASLRIAASLGLLSPPWTSLDLPLVIHEHWSYGRWILGASLAHGVAYGLYVPLVGALVGLEQTAVLRALQNLVLPLQQVLTGITMVAYPSMSRQVVEHGPAYLRRRGPLFLLVGVGLATVYGIAIAALGRPLLGALYGTGYYAGYASLMSLIALAAIMTSVAQFLSILVRVMNQPRAVLWSKLAAAAWLAGPGLVLVRASGVSGAAWSLAGGSLAEALVLAFVLTRRVALAAAASQ